MCAAVVPEVRLENVADTMNVWATGSIITVANPVPREGVGSLGPFKTATKVIGSAKATELTRSRSAKTKATFIRASKRWSVERLQLSQPGPAIAPHAATTLCRIFEPPDYLAWLTF